MARKVRFTKDYDYERRDRAMPINTLFRKGQEFYVPGEGGTAPKGGLMRQDAYDAAMKAGVLEEVSETKTQAKVTKDAGGKST